jgi:hypothetical protein
MADPEDLPGDLVSPVLALLLKIMKIMWRKGRL